MIKNKKYAKINLVYFFSKKIIMKQEIKTLLENENFRNNQNYCIGLKVKKIIHYSMHNSLWDWTYKIIYINKGNKWNFSNTYKRYKERRTGRIYIKKENLKNDIWFDKNKKLQSFSSDFLINKTNSGNNWIKGILLFFGFLISLFISIFFSVFIWNYWFIFLLFWFLTLIHLLYFKEYKFKWFWNFIVIWDFRFIHFIKK